MLETTRLRLLRQETTRLRLLRLGLTAIGLLRLGRTAAAIGPAAAVGLLRLGRALPGAARFSAKCVDGYPNIPRLAHLSFKRVLQQ